MAVTNGFGGFECGDNGLRAAAIYSSGAGVNGNAQIIFGLDKAHTGQMALALLNPITGANSRWTHGVSGAFGLPPVGDGSVTHGKCRVFMKIIQMPNSATEVSGFGFAAAPNNGSANATCVLNANGTFFARVGSFLSSAVDSAASSAVLVVDTWYRIDITASYTNIVASANMGRTCDVSIYTDAGTLIETASISSNALNLGITIGFPGFTIGGVAGSTKRIWFDDFWFEASDTSTPSFPTAMRVTGVEPTGQGASAAWTGDWRNVLTVPRTNVAAASDGHEQTTTGSGNTTTFTHETAATLGLSGIAAVNVVVKMRRTGGSNFTHAVMWNGTEFVTAPVSGTTFPSISEGACDFTAISNATFDAAEFGARTKNGDSIQLGHAMLEVLHAGTNLPVAPLLGPASFRIKIVGYSGDSVWGKAITGVGFKPSVVLIKKHGGVNSAGVVWMAGTGTLSKELDANAFSTHADVLRATSDGFDLGNNPDANATGATYVAICMQDGGLHPSGFLMTATYFQVSGSDNQPVTVGFQPDVVLTCGGTLAALRTTAFTGEANMYLVSTTVVTNGIQGFTATGFELGTDAAVGGTTVTFSVPWIAWQNPSNALDQLLHYGKQTGSTTSGTVTGMPFAPDFVVAGRPAVASNRDFRSASMSTHTGTTSSRWDTGATTAAGVTALTSDGFTGGSDLFSNGADTYWLAFVNEGSSLVAVPDVVGMTLAAATVAIEAALLEVGTVGAGDTNVVVAQSPVAGTFVAVGSDVDLLLGLLITPTTLPDPETAQLYSQQLTAIGGDGGPYTFSVVVGALPTGLALSASGLISGTATLPATLQPTSWPNGVVDIFYSQQLTIAEVGIGGTVSFTVRATDASGHTGDQAYTVTLVTGWTNLFFEVTAGTPPKCLTCTSTGLMRGFPMQVGTYGFTVQVINNAANTVTGTFTLTITS